MESVLFNSLLYFISVSQTDDPLKIAQQANWIAIASIVISLGGTAYAIIDRFILRPREEKEEFQNKFIDDNFSSLGSGLLKKYENNKKVLAGEDVNLEGYMEIENLQTRLQLGIIKRIDPDLHESMMNVIVELNPSILELNKHRSILVENIKSRWAIILNPDPENSGNHKGINERSLADSVLGACSATLFKADYESIRTAFDRTMEKRFRGYDFDYNADPYPAAYKQRFIDEARDAFNPYFIALKEFEKKNEAWVQDILRRIQAKIDNRA